MSISPATDPKPIPWKNPLLKYRLVTAAVLISIAIAIFFLGTPPQEYKPLTRSIDWDLTAQNSAPNLVVVPRQFEDSLPADLATWTVAARKRAFVDTVLPLVLRENERLLADRGRLLILASRRTSGRQMVVTDQAWLASMLVQYRVLRGDINELLHRVDVVPPSLALAQAAEESGWGTSRFARMGNALFGQWTFKAGAGMVPMGREQGASHEVKAYRELMHSVRDYIKNLNTHRAYRDLRQLRAGYRDQNLRPVGLELTTALARYSARGADYVHSLQTIIRVNDLGRFDGARLDDQQLAALNP